MKLPVWFAQGETIGNIKTVRKLIECSMQIKLHKCKVAQFFYAQTQKSEGKEREREVPHDWERENYKNASTQSLG